MDTSRNLFRGDVDLFNAARSLAASNENIFGIDTRRAPSPDF